MPKQQNRLLQCALAFPLLLLASITQSASAQNQITRAADVYPLMDKGKLIGCQLGFSVLRSDLEYSDGRPALVNGLILVNLQNASVGLRLGVATDAGLTRFKAPDRAYLFGGFKSNADDFVNKFDSSEEGFRFFVFKMADPTMGLLLNFLDTGSIDVMYAPANGSVDARFTFDLASAPDTHLEYLECMSALLDTVK